MSKRAKNRKMHDDLLVYMRDFDDDDMPDGAWQAHLMDSVTAFNKMNGTNLDPHDAFLAYCERYSAF